MSNLRPLVVSEWDVRKLPVHPAAALIPAMSAPDFAALQADIAVNGLLEAIVLYEGAVLDGRHRLRAALDVEAALRFCEYTGDDPAGFVLSHNLYRRHLSPSQRAALAVKLLPELSRRAKDRRLAGLRRGVEDPVREKGPARERGRARDQAADAVGVNPRYVSEAQRIRARDQELFERLLDGTTTLQQAKRELTRRDPAELRLRSGPQPEDDRYEVLMLDPHWAEQSNLGEVRPGARPAGLQRSDVEALDVESWAARDCILLLWVPQQRLPDGVLAMRGLGFRYVTNAVWIEDEPTPGDVVDEQAQLMVIGRRGHPRAPFPEDRRPSVLRNPSAGLKTTPEGLRTVLAGIFPGRSCLEVFVSELDERSSALEDES